MRPESNGYRDEGQVFRLHVEIRRICGWEDMLLPEPWCLIRQHLGLGTAAATSWSKGEHVHDNPGI